MFPNTVAENPSLGPAGGWQPASVRPPCLCRALKLVDIKIVKSSDSWVRLLGHTGLLCLCHHQLWVTLPQPPHLWNGTHTCYCMFHKVSCSYKGLRRCLHKAPSMQQKWLLSLVLKAEEDEGLLYHDSSDKGASGCFHCVFFPPTNDRYL